MRLLFIIVATLYCICGFASSSIFDIKTLKETKNTETGKALANKRHQFMQEYLDEFMNEWKVNF